MIGGHGLPAYFPRMEFTGTVIRKTFARGSKSEHEAVFLATPDGEYKLERMHGNPFQDPELEALVGKRITCAGRVIDYLLRIDSWREVGEVEG